MRIEACFDSHVHWAAAGDFSRRLRLDELKSPAEVSSIEPESFHWRGDWLLGFGWNDNRWTEKPHRGFLDQWVSDRPVALSRCDAHALWVNTAALKLCGLWDQLGQAIEGGRIERDESGQPTGILIDQAMTFVSKLIPEISPREMRHDLLKGVQIFNSAGYTHIRDMTCNELQWNEAVHLDEAGLLTLAVEEYFWLKDSSQIDSVLKTVSQAQQITRPNLRVKGVKVFFDGALGSEGAYLSRCYHGRDHCGLRLWEPEALKETLVRAWEQNFAVAVHVIGDEAADQVVHMAVELKQKNHKIGELHLEHAELLRPETITAMQGLNIFCHMQPSHWLSDREWLREKIGSLSEFAFPWRRLQENAIPFDFGSDAPIEPPSIARMVQALEESSEAGIPRLLGKPTSYMSHQDLTWAPNSYTVMADNQPAQVVFRGEHL